MAAQHPDEFTQARQRHGDLLSSTLPEDGLAQGWYPAVAQEHQIDEPLV